MSAESLVETPRTLKPRPPRSRCISLRLGISDLHGTHQVAQKFSSTTCPRRSESFMGLPSVVFKSTSGAGSAETAFAFAAAASPAFDGVPLGPDWLTQPSAFGKI